MICKAKASVRAVIPKLCYAYPQWYEPGVLGVREEINNDGNYHYWAIYLQLENINFK
jgi:hypothetical protein